MLQLWKLPWKWAWLKFFWPGCPNVAWGLPAEAKKCNWKRNNAHHKTFKCGRWRWVASPPHRVTTISSAGHQTNQAPDPLPHPEGYANSNYLPLRVDWVTYLNWFSRWGSCGKLPHLTAHPPHTVLLGFSVLGLWLVSRTQHIHRWAKVHFIAHCRGEFTMGISLKTDCPSPD